MGSTPHQDLIDHLRLLRSVKSAGIRGRAFGVCAFPSGQGRLTEEEYAPYLAAADGKHDSYMRHGAPWAATDLAYEVTVNDTVVAWLPYDGTPRVIERDFDDPKMNMARDLAREHLGAAPEVQQMLADDRGDIERLSAGGFAQVIYEHLNRAELGSRFNDFPADVSVRTYFEIARALKAQEEGAPRSSGSPRHYPHVPNPTVEYSVQQRREWAGKAAQYLAAFRERFPNEYTVWMTNQHLAARRTGKLAPLDVHAGDRIGLTLSGHPMPAIILKVEARGAELLASLRTQEEELHRKWIYPRIVTPEAELLPETRALWQPVWDRLTAPGTTTA
ncbi:hypothetical protein OHA27_37975 [Streptomyces sp. NBC_01619]|uniref:hypothetical protein n=1 Tax=Streptomyces sp. NBC_01619 TaxID=2975901 RepID=UPI00224FF4D5|nr:hypothetical protein [Streptomyces sp. NBC_01619]MCX4515910.1 hypothetical protein [Streptomyces sp. NBC_01619]